MFFCYYFVYKIMYRILFLNTICCMVVGLQIRKIKSKNYNNYQKMVKLIMFFAQNLYILPESYNLCRNRFYSSIFVIYNILYHNFVSGFCHKQRFCRKIAALTAHSCLFLNGMKPMFCSNSSCWAVFSCRFTARWKHLWLYSCSLAQSAGFQAFQTDAEFYISNIFPKCSTVSCMGGDVAGAQ